MIAFSELESQSKLSIGSANDNEEPYDILPIIVADANPSVEICSRKRRTYRKAELPPWKQRLYYHLGEMNRNYQKHLYCGEEKARKHLDCVANEDLALQLIDDNEERQKEAATIINKIAAPLLSKKPLSLGRIYLGRHQREVCEALAAAIGKSSTTAWRFVNKHITPEIGQLIQDPITYDQGFQLLLELYAENNLHQFRDDCDNEKVDSKDVPVRYSRHMEAPILAGCTSSSAAYPSPYNGNAIMQSPMVPNCSLDGLQVEGKSSYAVHDNEAMDSVLFSRVSKLFRKATGKGHATTGRFIRKTIKRFPAMLHMLQSPEDHAIAMDLLIKSYEERNYQRLGLNTRVRRHDL